MLLWGIKLFPKCYFGKNKRLYSAGYECFINQALPKVLPLDYNRLVFK